MPYHPPTHLSRSPPIFPTDNVSQPSDTDIMRSYAIDTLFASEYYTAGDTEEIEIAEALRAQEEGPQFIIAIKKKVHSLISYTKTLQPLTRTATGYEGNVDQKRVWKIRTTHKCKRKKKSNGEPDKHNNARAAARGDTIRRAMIKLIEFFPPLFNTVNFNWVCNQ
jgi:hypothetical protein